MKKKHGNEQPLLKFQGLGRLFRAQPEPKPQVIIIGGSVERDIAARLAEQVVMKKTLPILVIDDLTAARKKGGLDL